jgi:hypothetical protein
LAKEILEIKKPYWIKLSEIACTKGNLEIFKMVIAKKKNIDWNDKLSEACYGGNIELVQFLIKKVLLNGIMDCIEHVMVVILILLN